MGATEDCPVCVLDDYGAPSGRNDDGTIREVCKSTGWILRPQRRQSDRTEP